MNSRKIRWFVCYGVFALLLGISGQSLGQSAPPQSPAAQGGTQDRPPAVFRSTTRLVILDVVATDDKGQAITDLKAGDFTVLENGQPQEIIDFSFHTPGQITRNATQANIITNAPQFRNAGGANGSENSPPQDSFNLAAERGLAPYDARLKLLILAGNVNLEKIRDHGVIGHLESRAVAGELPDDAIDAGPAVVELDAPLNETFLPDDGTALFHGIG